MPFVERVQRARERLISQTDSPQNDIIDVRAHCVSDISISNIHALLLALTLQGGYIKFRAHADKI